MEQPVQTVQIIAPDTRINQRYRVVSQIGQGNMGAVYRAYDENLSQIVALKQTSARGETFRKAFEREAKILAELRHPVLPRVIDYFTTDEGQFMVMDFFPGEDLGMLLKQRGEPFLVQAVFRWADQILHALEYLHRQNPPVFHRDIKPQNLKLTAEGQIVLLDFGLATSKSRSKRDMHHMFAQPQSLPTDNKTNKESESSGHIEGSTDNIYGFTRQYAPLEQIQGTGTDPRSDIYAFAATMYHLLTATPPPDALTRIYRLGYDSYSHYEAGIETLLSTIEQHKPHHIHMHHATTYTNKLHHTIEQARRDGDSPALQAERADVIDTLDAIAHEALDVSFSCLCRVHIPYVPLTPSGRIPPEQDAESYDPLIPLHERNPLVPFEVSAIMHQALALTSDYRPSSAEAIRTRLQILRTAQEREANESDASTIPYDVFLPPHPPEPVKLTKRRKKSVVPLIVIIIVLVTQIILMIVNHSSPQTSRSAGNVLPVMINTPVPQPISTMSSINAQNIMQVAQWHAALDDVGSVAFSPDGDILATASHDHTVLLRSIHDGTQQHLLRGHITAITSIAWSPAHTHIAAGATDGTIRIWDSTSGLFITTTKQAQPTHDAIRTLVYSPNGTQLIAGTDSGTIQIWDGTTYASQQTIVAHTQAVRQVVCTTNGARCASASDDGSIVLWQVPDGAVLQTVPPHTEAITSIAFSPDGTLLAIATIHGTIELLQLHDDGYDTLPQTLAHHTTRVWRVAFSPNGEILAAASDDATITMWKVRDGILLHTLTAHTGAVYDVQFSPSGKLLASIAADSTIRLWGCAL